MNNRGVIKLADFGMARQFSDPPPPNLTQLVVTLWYRAPELLLGAEHYGFAIDMWSVGTIFAELLLKEPLLPGKNEVDQLSRAFALVGAPTDASWPGWRRLRNARALRLPSNSNAGAGAGTGGVGAGGAGKLRSKFPFLTAAGAALLAELLALDPARRPSAAEVLRHPYFGEAPKAKPTAMFPTFPSKAGGERRRKVATPSAPQRGEAPKISGDEFAGLFDRAGEEAGAGFSLRLG
jgi:cell division cycle 2-like protein